MVTKGKKNNQSGQVFSRKNYSLAIGLILASTPTFMDGGVAQVNAQYQDHPLLATLTESMTDHFTKYTAVFQSPWTASDKTEENKPNLWGQLMDISSIVLDSPSNRQRRKERFQSLTGEGPLEERVKLMEEVRENEWLDNLLTGDKNEIPKQKHVYEKLGRRLSQREERNLGGIYRPTEQVIYDFVIDQDSHEFHMPHDDEMTIFSRVEDENPNVKRNLQDAVSDEDQGAQAKPEENDAGEVNPTREPKEEPLPAAPPAQDGPEKPSDTQDSSGDQSPDDSSSQQPDSNQEDEQPKNPPSDDRDESQETDQEPSDGAEQIKPGDEIPQPIDDDGDIEGDGEQEIDIEAEGSSMDQPDELLIQVKEWYPNPPETMCQNDGQLHTVIQTYYYCASKTMEWRVIKETYDFMNTNPFYVANAKCRTELKENKICKCPVGFTGFLCQSTLQHKCYVNITEPAMSKGCANEVPSGDHYDFSIQGFDPCHVFDFTKEIQVKFRLNCKPVSMGVVKEEGHEEKFGFPYRDVLDTTPVSPQARFNYTAVNNQTKMAVIGDMAVSVVFDFRDWHYMTNIIRFDKVVTDPDVIAGLREDTLKVDLGQVTQADRVGNKTKFEVAGRLYWEAHVYGDGITPFTTNGFFDREGYEQPPFISKRDEVILLMWVIGILLLLLLTVATLCKCHTARLKKEAGIREMYRDHRVSPNKKKEVSPSKRTENNNRAQSSQGHAGVNKDGARSNSIR